MFGTILWSVTLFVSALGVALHWTLEFTLGLELVFYIISGFLLRSLTSRSGLLGTYSTAVAHSKFWGCIWSTLFFGIALGFNLRQTLEFTFWAGTGTLLYYILVLALHCVLLGLSQGFCGFVFCGSGTFCLLGSGPEGAPGTEFGQLCLWKLWLHTTLPGIPVDPVF